jgi:hypothetical protein
VKSDGKTAPCYNPGISKLTCSNCGKWIPLHGNVCPFCGADKTENRRLELLDKPARRRGIVGLAIGAAIGGIVGVMLTSVGQMDDYGGHLVMLILGVAAGATAGYVLVYRLARP